MALAERGVSYTFTVLFRYQKTFNLPAISNQGLRVDLPSKPKLSSTYRHNKLPKQ